MIVLVLVYMGETLQKNQNFEWPGTLSLNLLLTICTWKQTPTIYFIFQSCGEPRFFLPLRLLFFFLRLPLLFFFLKRLRLLKSFFQRLRLLHKLTNRLLLWILVKFSKIFFRFTNVNYKKYNKPRTRVQAYQMGYKSIMWTDERVCTFVHFYIFLHFQFLRMDMYKQKWKFAGMEKNIKLSPKFVRSFNVY